MFFSAAENILQIFLIFNFSAGGEIKLVNKYLYNGAAGALTGTDSVRSQEELIIKFY